MSDPYNLSQEEINKILAEIGSFVSEDDRPRISGTLIKEQLEAEIIKNALTVSEVSQILDSSEEHVRIRHEERTLIGFLSEGELLFSDLQFFNAKELPNWDLVAPSFPGDIHSVAFYSFMNNPSSELHFNGQDLTPDEWLISGNAPEALKAHIKYAFFEAGR